MTQLSPVSKWARRLRYIIMNTKRSEEKEGHSNTLHIVRGKREGSDAIVPYVP